MNQRYSGGCAFRWGLSFFALALLVCMSTNAQQQKLETSQQTNEKIEQLAALDRVGPVNTPIGAGDLLHIDVFDVPELSRDVRVSDTGDIGYPLMPGKIAAGGLSTFQLEAKLEQLLIENGLVSHPQVTVFVKEQHSQPISVIGAVRSPSVYQVIRPTTLLEVLAGAGGVTDDAGSEIIVTRQNDSAKAKIQPASATSDAPKQNQSIITIRLQDLLESGDLTYNIPVYGGDVVSVPRTGIVYVMGAGIAQPGGYALQSRGEQITVLKAVALARGLTVYAKSDSAVIMRNNPTGGQKDFIPVQIKRIENRKANDVPLKSNDVLYIPDSAGKKALAKGGEALFGIGTSVVIYHAAYQ